MTNQDKNRHCVYVLIDKYGVVRYVGEGTVSRSTTLSGRTEQYKKIYKDCGDILILYENLNKKEARALEYDILTRHKKEKIKGFDLINKNISKNITNVISYEECLKYFEISSTSPSGLVWKATFSNKILTGKNAGHLENTKYFRIQLFGVRYQAHRIVWTLHNKEDLDEYSVIDHIDSNPSNNNPENLNRISQQMNSLKATRCQSDKNFECNSRGVSKSFQNGSKLYRYRATVVDPNGKLISKSFSVRKYGEELALESAKKWREDMLHKFYNYQHQY